MFLFGIVRRNNKYQIKSLDLSINTKDFIIYEIGTTFDLFEEKVREINDNEIKVFSILDEFRESNPDLFTKITEKDIRVNDMTVKYSNGSYTSNTKHFYDINDNITGLNFNVLRSEYEGFRLDETNEPLKLDYGMFAKVPDDIADEIRSIINKQYFETKENLFNVISGTIKLLTGENLFLI